MKEHTQGVAASGEPSVLKRDFTLWSSFAFAFAFISPIVAMYGIFGLAITTAGPSFWWAFPAVFAGQLLVALVFALLVSRWPVEGSIYQWSRRLMGSGYGWFAGWAYMWTLVIAMATVALGAAGFVANILGVDQPSSTQKAEIAFIILLIGTTVNIIGRGLLRVFMTASICAEIVGSLGLGGWLLIFHRVNPISVITEGGAGVSGGAGGYFGLSGPFLIAMVFVGFSFVGFESAGAIAEEVKDPRRNLPKAVIASLTIIAAVVMFSSLAIILAIPDLGRVTSGEVADPVYDTLTTQLGTGFAKPIEGLFLIGFFASLLALQTSASRVIWSYARDQALPGATVLSRLSRTQHQPVAALVVTTVIGAVLFLLSNVAPELYTLMVNFTSGGFYLAFLFPLVGALVTQLRGKWTAATFDLRGWTVPVTAVATVWAVLQFVNISWPRVAYPQWYLNWSVPLGMLGIGVLGVLCFAAVHRSISHATVPEVDELNLDESQDTEVAV